MKNKKLSILFTAIAFLVPQSGFAVYENCYSQMDYEIATKNMRNLYPNANPMEKMQGYSYEYITIASGKLCGAHLSYADLRGAIYLSGANLTLVRI